VKERNAWTAHHQDKKRGFISCYLYGDVKRSVTPGEPCCMDLEGSYQFLDPDTDAHAERYNGPFLHQMEWYRLALVKQTSCSTTLALPLSPLPLTTFVLRLGSRCPGEPALSYPLHTIRGHRYCIVTVRYGLQLTNILLGR
jgi:hypothetical protein